MAHETDAVPPPEVVKAFALINGSAPEALDELHDALVATAATCHVWDPAGAVAVAASTCTSTVDKATLLGRIRLAAKVLDASRGDEPLVDAFVRPPPRERRSYAALDEADRDAAKVADHRKELGAAYDCLATVLRPCLPDNASSRALLDPPRGAAGFTDHTGLRLLAPAARAIREIAAAASTDATGPASVLVSAATPVPTQDMDVDHAADADADLRTSAALEAARARTDGAAAAGSPRPPSLDDAAPRTVPRATDDVVDADADCARSLNPAQESMRQLYVGLGVGDARAEELARSRDDTGTWEKLTRFGWPARHVPSAGDEAKAARDEARRSAKAARDEAVRVARVRRQIRERRRRQPELFGALWSGNWTREELLYVERVPQLFDLLDVPPGTLLADYLADRLDCAVMRISKKFKGDASVGRRFFCPDASASAETKEEARREVAELEAAWRRVREPKLEAAWLEQRAAIRAWLPRANAWLAAGVVGVLARGKAALAAAETAQDLDAAIADCERVSAHVASLRAPPPPPRPSLEELRLREELQKLRRDNKRLKSKPKLERLREELEQLGRDNDRLKRIKKAEKLQLPQYPAASPRKKQKVTGAASPMREKLIKWKLSGCTVAVTPITVIDTREHVVRALDFPGSAPAPAPAPAPPAGGDVEMSEAPSPGT